MSGIVDIYTREIIEKILKRWYEGNYTNININDKVAFKIYKTLMDSKSCSAALITSNSSDYKLLGSDKTLTEQDKVNIRSMLKKLSESNHSLTCMTMIMASKQKEIVLLGAGA